MIKQQNREKLSILSTKNYILKNLEILNHLTKYFTFIVNDELLAPEHIFIIFMILFHFVF